ncbi:hypothetical protein EUX98_g2784 [Antrodiella citrinella]|uniref:F-box domain-containing protein n=1 Tax=Antrodiella citrinella TaxID=2447956 RepID=A0A4S4N129_9APHY|nr:hypothetical protein EUX98_g2784 [Antrodiella citrinella]
MPYELWKIIFLHVAADLPFIKARESAKMSAVCRFWRQIVVESSELWDVFALDLDRTMDERSILLMIRRSGLRHLHVYLTHQTPEMRRCSSTEHECARLRRFIHILSLCMGRVKTWQAELSCSSSAGDMMLNMQGAATSLKELTLLCPLFSRQDPRNRAEPAQIVFNLSPWIPRFQAPHLENLTLSVACFRITQTLSHFASIRSLTLVLGTENVARSLDGGLLLKTLAALPSLTYLKIDGSSVPIFDLSNSNFPAVVFEFPSLQYLCMDTVSKNLFTSLLTCVRFPALVRLDITNLYHFLTLYRIFTHLNTQANAPLLQTLRLCQFGPNVLCSIFPHLTFCRTLILHQAVTLDDPQLLMLSMPHGTETWFCPNVTSLELDRVPLITVHALRCLVRERKTQHANTPGQGPNALVDLKVFHTAPLGEVHKAWFRDNVPTFHWGVRRASIDV